jgi:hypothetical protein
VLSSVVKVANAQSSSTFANGEGQRVFDLLDGLGCIGNRNCPLHDFVPSHACNANANELKCNNDGFLASL